MSKQTNPKEKEEVGRKAGPRFNRDVIPTTFQIRRPTSPMADILQEANDGRPEQREARTAASVPKVAPVKNTPVESTLVHSTPVKSPAAHGALPDLDTFLDRILPRFPPPRQAVLLRLYRWSEGLERELVVSTPRLAAKTNMDEKACRMHLHALIADGYLLRHMDGSHHAKFGGNDRSSRGLILSLSAAALAELID